MNALDFTYAVAAILTAPIWLRKQRGGWSERFGHAGALPPKTGPRVLVHAVSVGETNALRTLVPLLARDVEVVVTASTDTGLARAIELFAGAAHVRRYPLDFSRSVERFLDTVQVDAVALVELELWPNLVRACRARGVPVCVINGRLSERSFKGYRRLGRFIRPSFASLEFAAVQNAEYSGRFEAMGVAPNRCFITGSMKFDAGTSAGSEIAAAAERLAVEMGIDRTRPLVVAGSTAPGEHELLHQAVPAGVQLLCAPRRPEWFDQAATALPGCVRRSTGPHARTNPCDRFLLDSIGELRSAYALADAAVVGRSFGDLFGSDPIEPILLGKPTLIGPAVADFRHIVEALAEAGGIVRTTAVTLASDLARVLGDDEHAEKLVERGLLCVRANQGASERHAELLMSLLDGRPGAVARG